MTLTQSTREPSESFIIYAFEEERIFPEREAQPLLWQAPLQCVYALINKLDHSFGMSII